MFGIDLSPLNKLITAINALTQAVTKMATTLSQLDTALTTLTAAVTQESTDDTALITAVQILIAALKAAAPTDFTDEIKQVNAAIDTAQKSDAAVQAATQAANLALTPPAPGACCR